MSIQCFKSTLSKAEKLFQLCLSLKILNRFSMFESHSKALVNGHVLSYFVSISGNTDNLKIEMYRTWPKEKPKVEFAIVPSFVKI